MTNLQTSLKRSAIGRQSMIARFGFMPFSILKLSRQGKSKSIYIYQNDNPERKAGNDEKRKARQEKLKDAGYKYFRQIPTQKNNGRGMAGISIMPAELVEFFIKYYTTPAKNYLDPFMGQGIQMQVAKMMGLNYYGYDLCEEFYEYISLVKDKIDDGTSIIQTTLGDSRYPDAIPHGIGDFCFTSPPYWDIEYYGDDDRQLGTNHSYAEFLTGMFEVASAWLPKFKQGSYIIINVNDFRKNGQFYPYHADCITLFKQAGYRLHDIWIIEGLVGGLPKAFALDFNSKRIAPKIHEYAMVFQCP